MLRVVDEAVRSDTGRQRHGNEDSYYARTPIYVIADGMGGAQSGEVASRIATDVFDEDMGDGNAEEQLAERAREANRRIFELARDDEAHSGMGTTLTGALVGGDEVTIVHVGDSRAYMLRDGELRRLTRDHSLVEELRRRGQLTSAEAEGHPQRSVITRALGPEPDVEPDVHTHQARPGDVFLLCSDGLTDMLSEDRLQDVLAASASLREAVDRLVEEANAAGGRDNITVIAFRVGGDADGAHDVEETSHDLRAAAASATAPAGEPTGEPAVARAEPPAAARSGTPPPPRRAPRRRRRVRLLAIALVAVVVLAGAGIGAAAGLRHVYFVGSDRGLVTLYRGVPYELPLGIELYQKRYVSSVPVRALSITERRRLLDHQLRSKNDASDLIRGLERGKGYGS